MIETDCKVYYATLYNRNLCERCDDQHVMSVGQIKSLSSRRESNPRPYKHWAGALSIESLHIFITEFTIFHCLSSYPILTTLLILALALLILAVKYTGGVLVNGFARHEFSQLSG